MMFYTTHLLHSLVIDETEMVEKLVIFTIGSSLQM